MVTFKKYWGLCKILIFFERIFFFLNALVSFADIWQVLALAGCGAVAMAVVLTHRTSGHSELPLLFCILQLYFELSGRALAVPVREKWM